jgi:hypothetical protein
MTAVSTPATRAAARPAIIRSALVVIAVIAIAAGLAFVAINAFAGTSQATTGYDAPFYSQFLQEMSQGW